MTKTQDKNLNILRTKRAFKVTLKAFFIIFIGISVDKNNLRPESVPLTEIVLQMKPSFSIDDSLLMLNLLNIL